MIASAPTMNPSSSGVEPGAAARHGSERSAGSAQSARSFERTLNDARDRSDAGPRRSERAHATGEQVADESTTSASTPAGTDTGATSGAGAATDTTAGSAATVADTATPVAVAAGAISGAGLSALPGPVAGTTSTTTGGASSGTATTAVTGTSATGTAVLSGVATGVVAAALDLGGAGVPTAGAMSQPGQPASATAPGAVLGLTVTVEVTDAPGHGTAATASSGSPAPAAGPLPTAGITGAEIGAATTTTTTGLDGHASAGPSRAIDPAQPTAGQLTPAAVATPASSVLTPATTPAGSASVPQWLQQAVQAQLTGRLVAAARGSDAGSVQRLTLHLHPADLGAVQVVATLDDGTVSLQLLAGNPATREALRASLGVLRSDLAAAGLDGTQLDVSDQPPGQQSTPQQQSGGWSDGPSRAFTGSPGAAHAMAAGRSDIGQVPSPGGADVRARPPARSQGVDLRL